MTCKICAGKTILFIKNIFDDRYGYSQLFDIYKCTSCQSFLTEPRLAMSEIEALYTNFYPRKNITAESVKKRAHVWKRQNMFGQWLSGEHRIHRSFPKVDRSGIKVLDVGCGDGSSLLELRSLGYEVYGIETDMNVGKIKDELGLTVHIGTIEDAPFKEHSFNYIIANQVVEHVVNLDGFYSNIQKFLAPRGIAIVSTPNAKSIFRTIYNRHWIHWHIPYHQQILSTEALKLLSEKHELTVTKTKNISPSSWTMHEINRKRFEARPGLKNPFWTPEGLIVNTLAGKIWRKAIFIFMSTLGKIFNLFGHGNCIMVYSRNS